MNSKEIVVHNHSARGVFGAGYDAGQLPAGLAQWLALLEGIQSLRLLPNDFVDPPEALVAAGMHAVRTYYRDFFAEGFTEERHDVKVVVVGMAGAGKTSLRQSIVKGASHPTTGSEESTVHLDIDHVDLNGVSVSLYDCAGQVAYYGLLQMFITRRALCLVVCDTSSFEARQVDLNDERQLESDIKTLKRLGVCDWLRCLSWRLPECDVVLVGTKCDLLQDDVAEDIASRIENACQAWVKFCEPSGMRIRVESGVSLTSCAGRVDNREAGKRWECDWLEDEDDADSTSLLQRIIHKGGSDERRGAAMALPRSWLVALTTLEALAAGRDPIQLVRQRLKLDGAVSEEGRGDKTERQKEYGVLTIERLEEEWLTVARKLERTHGIKIPSPGSALEGALLIKEYGSRILRHGAYVFLDVTRLATILKPILHHNPMKLFDGSLSLGEMGGSKIVLTTKQQKMWWKLLEKEGLLHPELARVFWPDGLAEFVLPTLLRIGLAFSYPGDNNDRLVVMLRLPEEPPKSATEDLENIFHSRYAALRVSWNMLQGVPPGLIENVLVRCCGLGDAKTFWRFGVQVEGDFGENDLRARFVVRSVYSRIDGELVMDVYGNLAFPGPWAALSYIMSAMLSMTRNFPGLRWEATLRCPTHSEHTLDVSEKACQAGDKIFDRGACGKCTKRTRGLGAFAEELLEVVDIITESRPRGLHLRSTDKMFGKFGRRFDHLRGSADRKSGEVEASQRFLQDLMRDFIGAMEAIGQRDALFASRAEAIANMRTLGHSSVPAHTPYSNSPGDILRHNGVTDMEAELRGIRQQLTEISDVIRKQGEETHEMVGFVITMMKAVRAHGSDTPRLACLLPPWTFDQGEGEGLSEREQEQQEWTKRLLDTRRNRKGWFTKEARLFLVCAHSHRLVPCGPRGQGYVIRNLRTWLNRSAVAARVALCVTFACLGVAAAGQLASSLVDEMGSAVLGVAQEEIQAKIEDYLESLTLTEERQEVAQQAAVEELEGEAYEALRDFVHEVEDTARAEHLKQFRKAGKGGGGVAKPSFAFFSDVMEKVQSEQDGAVHWVLKGEKSAWLKAERAPGRS